MTYEMQMAIEAGVDLKELLAMAGVSEEEFYEEEEG